jgi:Ca-activated chloride channel family protein
LLATVKNAKGDAIGTLSRDNFRILDNGVEQSISVFEKSTQQPLSVTVLLDVSLSTAKELRYEIDAITKFLQALIGGGNPADQASLYSFNDEITQLSSFTRNLGRLRKQLALVKPDSGTSLYDAIWIASQAFEGREGRKVIISVTDGGDTTSAKKFRDALEAAHRADAIVYPILVVPIQNEAGRNTGGENALTLLAGGTGGRVFTPTIGKALEQAFADILSDLRTQYLLGYYPKGIPPARDPFHRVQVQLLGPAAADLRVSTRNGYYES